MTSKPNESLADGSRPGIRSNLLRMVTGLLILLALFSRNSLDPTPFNLVWPFGGVDNILSLPGALLAGLLYDLFGWCALVIPTYLLFLKSKNSDRKLRQLLFSSLYFLLLVSFVALCLPPENRYLGEITGFWGTASSSGLLLFPGRLISLMSIAIFVAVNLTEYRFNVQMLEIFKIFVGALLWHGQRMLTICTASFVQKKQLLTEFWRKSVIPYWLKRNDRFLQKIESVRRGFGSRITRMLPTKSFETIISNSTELFKSRMDSPVSGRAGNKYADSQTTAWEYKIFQEALTEFEQEYYQSYFPNPTDKGDV